MTERHTYDLFITHAWRFHDDWNRLAEMMDGLPDVSWRNFSLPWHDPAMDPRTEVGGRFIRSFLETQIIPVRCVIFLSGVYEVKSNRRWLDLEVEMARQHRKPVVALPALGSETIPDEVAALADARSNWDVREILATIDKVI
ncbi:MAG: hypothetical protein GC151_06135 [Betaproteobacteria bacterium]|nr:hypothetical protein [Betaproteobacteria bacterium]